LQGQGLSDRQWLEDLGNFGLPDLGSKLGSYRAVLCEIKKRGNFPHNKPTSHGGRILAAWGALLGKRRRDREAGAEGLSFLFFSFLFFSFLFSSYIYIIFTLYLHCV
jgi:hypothetical protein